MSLQAKILLIVLAVVSLYAALDYASQYLFVLPSFVSLERNETQNTMRRCIGALQRKISNLDKLTKDWAARDDIYQFVEEQNNRDISTNLLIESFAKNNLNLIYICNIKGEVVWGEIRDLQTDETIQVDKFFAESLAGNHLLLGHKTGESSTAGIFMTERGPMLVASRPIFTSENEGPIRGTLIMGRAFNNNVVEALAGQTHVDLKMWTIGNGSIPVNERDVFNHIKEKSQFHIREISDTLLRVYTLFPDIQGAPALLMRADIPRDIMAKAVAGLIKSSLLSNLTTGLFVLLILFLLLRCTVVGPIRKLTSHAIAIGHSDNISARLTMNRSDEIGTLAREFDHMVERLAETRKKLLEQSYRSGMAEMASGVLHNVRNVLTPMVLHIDGLRQRLREAPIAKIEMARAELTKARPSGKRKEDLNSFIDIASKSLVRLVQETKGKLDSIAEQIFQIERMLFEQSKFSRTELLIEEIELDKLVRDSIDLLPDDIREAISIKIDPCIEAMVPIKTCSVALLQVLNNILINAAESILRAGLTHGEIRIRAETNEIDGKDMIELQISDNGEGIEPCNLNRIFERGFSTKQKASSGIGLHWCANTIAKMNGRIYAESQGRKYGACIHVLLPASKKTVYALD